MELRIIEHNGRRIAEAIDNETLIATVQDAVDLLGNADYLGARGVLAHGAQFAPAFFDLKTRIAGEILQKFANYHMRLAIVGDFSDRAGASLRAFIAECNRGRHVFFASDKETALRMLAAKA
jgi:hypothetical protein